MVDVPSNDPSRSLPGPRAGIFPTTQWSVVCRAQDGSIEALNSILLRYRGPLLVCIRSHGHSPHDAEDLVQEFLAMMLRREAIQRIDRDQGRFRSYLRTALRHFLHDRHDRDTAGIRGGGQPVASLDENHEDGQRVHQPSADVPSPDEAFDQAWARAVLENSLRRLEEECHRQSKAAVFRELEPVLFRDETSAPYVEIGGRLQLSEGAVKVVVHRLRQRLRAIVREEVLETVTDEADLPEEVRYLTSLFVKAT